MFDSEEEENKLDSEEDEYGMFDEDDVDLGRGEPFSFEPVLSKQIEILKDVNGNLYKLI